MENVKVLVPLGGFALKWLEFALRAKGVDTSQVEDFAHGNVHAAGKYKIVTSFHVSPMNTYTGKLTEKMFADVLKLARKMAQSR